MHGTLTPTGDWTYGAAILSFAFPMLLFIAVASALYVLYTKPHLVPGHRYNMQLRAITATAAPETTALGRPTIPPAVDTDAIRGLAPPENEG